MKKLHLSGQFIAGVLGLFCAVTSLADSGPGYKPNIVLIVADDMGFEVPGYLGGSSYHTPNLDALAENGMQLNAVFASPSCHPSRIMLMTGRYPFEFEGLEWGGFPTAAEPLTLAHVLKSAGYATAIAGKWQLTLLRDDPKHAQRLGFEESFLFGWHEGPRYHGPLVYRNGDRLTYDKGEFGPDLYREFLVEFMRRNLDESFFIYYSMALPHSVSDDLEEPPPYPPGRDRWHDYREMIQEMDQNIGKVVEAISDAGVAEKTLIIVTADNGTPRNTIVRHDGDGYLREPNVSAWRGRKVRGGKGTLRETGIRVPTLAVWPGVVPAGASSEILIDFTDFLPTFSEIAGASSKAETSGRSFAGLLIQRQHTNREWIFTQQLGPNPEYCVRSEQWKLDHTGTFFHVSNDLAETPVNPMSSAESWDAYQSLNGVVWTMRKSGLR